MIEEVELDVEMDPKRRSLSEDETLWRETPYNRDENSHEYKAMHGE